MPKIKNLTLKQKDGTVAVCTNVRLMSLRTVSRPRGARREEIEIRHDQFMRRHKMGGLI